jgi:hypothetical protein
VITCVGGLQLSRSTVLAMAQADARERAAERAAAEAARIRQERAEAALQRQVQEHFAEFGEMPWESQQRRLDAEARGEARRFAQEQEDREVRRQEQTAALLMQGHQPRTIGEILSIAAMMP